MNVKSFIKPVELTSITSGSLTGDYQAINADGIGFACFLVRITSTSSTEVTLSFDGVTDHEIIPANGGVIEISSQNNSLPPTYTALFSASTKVYAKGTAGTGSIYVSAYYQPAVSI